MSSYHVPTNLISQSYLKSNNVNDLLDFRKILDSKEFKNLPSNLTYVKGKDENGKIIFGDFKKDNSMLITGGVGQGKTNFLYSLILSLVYKNSPDDLKFFLIDSARVAFSDFKDLPHLFKRGTYKKSLYGYFDLCFLGLELAIEKGYLRKSIIADANCKTFDEYVEKEKSCYKPYYFVIIDELADLMLVDKEKTLKYLKELINLQDCGVYLILGTRVVNENILPKELLKQIKTKISFKVNSEDSSLLVLNESGAEYLDKSGEMIFKKENEKSQKYITPFVFTSDAQKVSTYINNHGIYSI